ncbi:sugar ABC transporter ATP-binding protein [Rhizobium sp. KVB221]|uniref:Sugar ABC transporter ATP-binding protein n=1 Tax=Rhizobium setariae TaxID=2801340 RepID=A0A936YWX5_9HYPH|nr:sugar ABC transporter ATP-binding protein [Rhizobium setariae]MBL0375180.1 sugar ABC transporter ATP-binding protein [Rhizobium setariae]
MFKLSKIEKSFPGVHALKNVDFEIRKGEIVGLVGENGAGKSTLMKVMYGAYVPESGEISLDGKPVRFANPRDAQEKGVGMVFQEQSLISNLTVMENIFLGFEKPFVRMGLVNWKKMATAARKQLEKVRLDIDPATITSELSFAQRQLVELAKVLSVEERVHGDLVILLDEPTSVLSPEEVQMLFQLVRDLRSRAAFIFVSHRMDEIIELSDRIYVMKDGEVVSVVNANEAVVEDIQRKMVGRDVDAEYYREARQLPYCTEKPLLQVKKISHAPVYKDIAFDLHPGEVLALVGTEGSGTEEIMRSIFGMVRPDAGEIRVNGEVVSRYSPADAVEHGIAYIPRERKVEGIAAGMNVFENMTLPQLSKYSRFGLINQDRERTLAKEWIKKLSIKASSEEADCGRLSGGNQQKVVLAKWRSAGSKIVILDHPTRGLDIGAKEDVYEMVRDMCADGCAVILAADTLEEAIGLSHTILVIKDGEIQERFDGKPGAKPTLFDLVHHMV